MATDLTKAADVPRLKKTIKAILHLRFGSFVGVALLHLRFGPFVGVEHFSELQNAFFNGPYFTSLILNCQNLDHLLKMLLCKLVPPGSPPPWDLNRDAALG